MRLEASIGQSAIVGTGDHQAQAQAASSVMSCRHAPCSSRLRPADPRHRRGQRRHRAHGRGTRRSNSAWTHHDAQHAARLTAAQSTTVQHGPGWARMDKRSMSGGEARAARGLISLLCLVLCSASLATRVIGNYWREAGDGDGGGLINRCRRPSTHEEGAHGFQHGFQHGLRQSMHPSSSANRATTAHGPRPCPSDQQRASGAVPAALPLQVNGARAPAPGRAATSTVDLAREHPLSVPFVAKHCRGCPSLLQHEGSTLRKGAPRFQRPRDLGATAFGGQLASTRAECVCLRISPLRVSARTCVRRASLHASPSSHSTVRPALLVASLR